MSKNQNSNIYINRLIAAEQLHCSTSNQYFFSHITYLIIHLEYQIIGEHDVNFVLL